MDKAYIFNDIQMQILLNGLGYKEILALDLKTEAANDEDILRNLNNLMKNGIISPEQSSFIVCNEVKGIINIIGSAKLCLIIKSYDEQLPNICVFYDGDEFAAAAICGIKADRRSVYKTDIEGLVNILRDEGYFPQNLSDVDIDEEELDAFEREKLNSNENGLVKSPLVLSVDYIKKNRSLPQRLYLIKYYFYSYLLYCGGASKIRLKWSEDSFARMLERMLEE